MSADRRRPSAGRPHPQCSQVFIGSHSCLFQSKECLLRVLVAVNGVFPLDNSRLALAELHELNLEERMPDIPKPDWDAEFAEDQSF